MQKVACATASVHVLNGTPAIAKEDRSAIPVTMPGSAIGSSTRNEIASRPKNRVR